MKIDISDLPGIEIDPNRMGGKPVICNTRIPAAQILAELSEGHSLGEIAYDFGFIPVLEAEFKKNCQNFLGALSLKLDVKG